MLPPGVSTKAVKNWKEKFYGSLIRSSDSPNNYQQFHLVTLQCDSANVGSCVPSLGASDGLGYILTDYDTDGQKGQLATVTLTYSVQSAYTPNATAVEQSSTRQVSITQWSGFASTFGNGTAPTNGALFKPDSNGNFSVTSSFDGIAPYLSDGTTNPYAGNENYEVATISYTYTEYSTSEFDSDADLCGTIQTPADAPTLGSGGNWLLMASNRGKTSYFYTKANTYVASVPPYNSTIYAA
jgi:hypothetical protein